MTHVTTRVDERRPREHIPRVGDYVGSALEAAKRNQEEGERLA